MRFISVSCLIAQASTVLNKSGESGHPCFVPYLRGKAFGISSLSMTLAVGLSYIAFIMLVCWVLSWMDGEFCQMLFCIYWDDYMIFILHFVNVVYHIDWFAYVEPSLHLRVQDDHGLCMILLMYCWIWFPNTFYWGFLHLSSSGILANNFLVFKISSLTLVSG